MRKIFKKSRNGNRKNCPILPKIFQNTAKTGRISVPIVSSHAKIPATSPILQPMRISPEQTPKFSWSQAQNKPIKKRKSEKWGCRCRNGRKNP